MIHQSFIHVVADLSVSHLDLERTLFTLKYKVSKLLKRHHFEYSLIFLNNCDGSDKSQHGVKTDINKPIRLQENINVNTILSKTSEENVSHL